MTNDSSELGKLLGQTVVLDARSLFTYAGTLVSVDQHYVVLEDADVHDLRDTTTSREVYVVELKKLGIRPNRVRVLVRRDEVLSISALDDVID